MLGVHGDVDIVVKTVLDILYHSGEELPQLLGLHRDGGAVGDQLGQECGEVGGV